MWFLWESLHLDSFGRLRAWNYCFSYETNQSISCGFQCDPNLHRTHFHFAILCMQVLQGCRGSPVGVWHFKAPYLWECLSVAKGTVWPCWPAYRCHAGRKQVRPGLCAGGSHRGCQELCRYTGTLQMYDGSYGVICCLDLLVSFGDEWNLCERKSTSFL